MNACIAITDPYSAGVLLARRLRHAGAECIGIRTSREPPPIFSEPLERGKFDDIVDDHCRLEPVLRQRYGTRLTHIVAGTESGVELADRLSENLGLPTNGTRLSRARRDKFRMAEAVRARGLRTADVFCSGDIDEILRWTGDRNEWPVVIKPVCSIASDNIHLCFSAGEACRAASGLLGHKNALGIINDRVLVQAYLNGPEYVVDTVSLDGHHKVTAFWVYQRSENRVCPIGYDAMTLLPYHGALQESLSRYTSEVLDALEITFGPAHCELIWCDGAPVLVELGARLTAGRNAMLSGMCAGISQLDETVKAVLDPVQFHETGLENITLKKNVSNIFLYPGKSGRLKRIRYRKELSRLETLYRLSLGVKPGQILPRVSGMVTLLHPDAGAIERDIDTIRSLEKKGIFEVEPD